MGGIEIVVAILRSALKRVGMGQMEHSLGLCHEALLTALQIGLSWIVWHRIPLSVHVAILCAHEFDILIRARRVLIIIIVEIPVYIDSDHVFLLRVDPPLASCRCTGIAIHEVVGVDVTTGIESVGGAIDALGVVGALGIEFRRPAEAIGQSLPQLPVGELIGGLRLSVGEDFSLCQLSSRVLPSVIVLQLEVGAACPPSSLEAHTGMLAHIVVAAIACCALSVAWVLLMFTGDDIDDTCHGVAAIQGRLRSLDNLYALYILRINKSEVVLSAHVAMYAFAIYQYEDVGVAETAQLHLRPHVSLGKGKRSSETTEDVLNAPATIALQHLARDDLCLHRHIAQQTLRARGSDDDLSECVTYLLCCRNATAQNSR